MNGEIKVTNKHAFDNIPTTCITDALDSTNYMDGTIMPLTEDWHVSGPAFTVNIEAGENISVLEAIYKANPGDVLVIDGKGWTNHAFAGDFIVGLAKTKGLNGIIADGVVRDIRGTKELNYPVFCKGTTTAAGRKNKIGQLNVPIKCGGVYVSPGDIIVGDADGVVVVPKSNAALILDKAKTRLKKDEDRDIKVGTDIDMVNEYLEEVLSKNKVHPS